MIAADAAAFGTDAVIRAELGAFALELARIAGLVVATPLLWVQAPKRVKAGLVFALAVVVHGHGRVAPEFGGSPELAVLGILSEFALGAAMGLVVRLAVSAAEVAANSAAPMIGFGVAQIFDPSTGESETVLAAILRYFALWIALISGVHHVIIGSLLASFRAVPVGSFIAPGHAAGVLLDASSTVIATGVRLSLPLVAVLFMVQLALGFISRAAPAMQIFSVGFAFMLVIGGLVLILSMPDMSRELLEEFARIGPRIEAVLQASTERG